MTAVEWLEEQYTKQITFLHIEDFEQAKEMEKQQQGYSEEEVRELVEDYEGEKFNSSTPLSFRWWFEQIKKK